MSLDGHPDALAALSDPNVQAILADFRGYSVSFSDDKCMPPLLFILAYLLVTKYQI